MLMKAIPELIWIGVFLEGDPHSVIEGLAIAAFAITQVKSYFMCAQSILAVERINKAIKEAYDMVYWEQRYPQQSV